MLLLAPVPRLTTGNKLRFDASLDISFTEPGLHVRVQLSSTSPVKDYSGTNLLDIVQPGTYSAPGSGKARFAKVSAQLTNPTLYELQLEDNLFSALGNIYIQVVCDAGLLATLLVPIV